ncbi:MAG: glycosyltransferase family 4 protein [Pantoea dispersa]|uniref:glycosyltransferase family 4 protein n=1 Tax=Pantoea dispersa TaxID=59814 RepID=UPI002854F285|nr:glycosyltransferase family 4 protein [Pantoea dispersa]MDR6295890.1 glycosyltransferase involved in cell wall biosynthesis [Pantoea dispersa]
MKKKILFIVPSLKNAGPVNVCLTIINNLPEFYDIEVLALNDGERKEEFASRSKVTIFKRTAVLQALKFIRQGGFSVIHSHCTVSDIFNYLSFSSASKVTTIHNYFEVDFVQTKGLIKGKIEGLVGRFIIRRFYKVACSYSVMKHCVSFHAMKKVTAIPNGVEQPLSFGKKNNDDMVHYFYLGVLNKRKNVQQVLEAFSQWCQGKRAELHIIGSGSDEVYLRQQYSNDKIIFHGNTDQPYFLYKEFDCFISASHAEGLPLALIESMASGKTFICSDIEPHKEVHNAFKDKSGFLFDKTVAGLIACLEEYYRFHDKASLADNAINNYSKNYSAKKMALSYSELYQKI